MFSKMFFDSLFLIWICNNNIDSDLGGRYENSVDEGPNFVHLKTEIFAKNSDFGFGNSADIWRSSIAIVFI